MSYDPTKQPYDEPFRHVELPCDAERALRRFDPWKSEQWYQGVLTAVTPLIEAAVLERAAKVAEDAEAQEYEAHTRLKAEGKEEEALIYARYAIMAKTIAAAIRALKDPPPNNDD